MNEFYFMFIESTLINLQLLSWLYNKWEILHKKHYTNRAFRLWDTEISPQHIKGSK